MLTFKHAGRMGNFLFQAAATIAYANKHGLDFTVPTQTNSTADNPLYLQHLARKDFNPALPSIVVKEQTFTYGEIPFHGEWRESNIVLQGWWQSEKYFKDYRKEVVKAFGFPWEIRKNLVSVHVRRGDYLRLVNKHPAVPVEWIDKAMGLFTNCGYYFFSDDIVWCKETFGKRSNVIFSEGQTVENDLIMMSCCEHQICSASTFSWWAAYLNRNPNKRIIMPKNWFVPGFRDDPRDIVPAEWTRL